jgi:hypothetical protein
MDYSDGELARMRMMHQHELRWIEAEEWRRRNEKQKARRDAP